MSMPLCRQVIQGWMDIAPFRLVNEASMSGRVIAQHWQLRKAGMQWQKLQHAVELVRVDDVRQQSEQRIAVGFPQTWEVSFLLGACRLKDR